MCVDLTQFLYLPVIIKGEPYKEEMKGVPCKKVMKGVLVKKMLMNLLLYNLI